MKVSLIVSLFLVTFLYLAVKVDSGSLEEDLTISEQQRTILNQFRDALGNRLPHEYMKKDIHLVRWLRANNFNMQKAEQALLNNLKWRESNRIDYILAEDFSDLERDLPISIETYHLEDRTGLVAYFNMGVWDIRAGILQGKREKGVRYMDRYLEQMTSKVRQLQENGLNITQFDFVVNMDGVNLITVACLQCLPLLPRFLLSYETHYPNTANLMYIVNTPASFQVILNRAKEVLSQRTRNSLQIYGTNREEWQPKLFNDIPRKYLPVELGGNILSDD